MPASLRPRRSALFVPGSNDRAVAKAGTVAADVLIFDLEDSVAPAHKEIAREAVATAVAQLVGGRREIVVRINDLDSPWVARDIAAMAAVKPDALLVPKIERTDDIRRIRAALGAAQATKSQNIWVMIETPAAIRNAAAIAAVAAMPAPPIAAFVVGTNDLGAELRVPARPGRAALLPHLSHAVLAARAHNLAVLDGTFNDLDDRKALQAECRQGRDLGMDGKTVIHPSQIAIANEAFSPDPEELLWARRVVEAFALPDNSGVEVMRLAGRMVERLHERAARRVIELAEAIAAMDDEMREKAKVRRPTG
jgi:citrate lyase subunit beta/citryl-CoA lyase